MKKIFILTIFSVLAFTASAQTNLTMLTYSIGFGTGDMHDYIAPASFRGMTFDYRKMINPEVGIGVDFGWNVFYDELADDVYSYNNVTLSGKQWRYSNHFPMLAVADYFINQGEPLSGYAGLGVGTMYTLQNTDMSTYTFERDAWHFTVMPEAGIIMQTAGGAAFTVGAKYYYGFEASDLPAQGYVSLNVGMVFGL